MRIPHMPYMHANAGRTHVHLNTSNKTTVSRYVLHLQGDWGTQFGMLIQFLAEEAPGGLTDPSIADLELPQLQARTCHI